VEIVGIDLNRTGVRNAELANLAAAPGLRELSLANTPITDEGLAHILPLRQLTHLNLAETDITSGGLAQLSRLANLIELDLQKTQITDQGLSRLAGLAALERLYLADTEVTDIGIDQLKGLKSLKLLTLNNTGFSEAGHASLVASLPELQIAWDGADAQRAAAARLLEKGATLTLIDRQNQLHQGLKTRDALPAGRVVVKEADLSSGMGMDDDDLKLLVSLPEIESLRLVNVSVSPAGLGHLHALATLKKIDLGTLRVPAAAVAALQKALPGCQVVSMEPADVEVARAVIAGMGRVTVVTERGLLHTDLNAVDKLPAGNYSIRAINLEDSAAATDEFLAQMVELPALESLYLSRSGITDDGVAQLAGAQSLRELSLTGTKITAASIGVLPRLPALTRLYLAHTDIGSEGARLTANISGLTHLSLQDVKLADDDLALLKRLEKLEWLDLSGTPITDSALTHLSHLQTLRELHIADTQITDAGQEELVALLPNCRAVGDPLDFQRLAVRWVLQNKGTVVLDSGPITSLKALPRDACHILSIDLAELALLRPSDIVKHLLGCSDLQALNLSVTPIREIDLPVVSKLVTLKELRLAGVPATDASLKHFEPLSRLEVLDLSGTRVSGSGLRELGGCTELRQLVLAGAQFDERNMAAIEPFAKLELLDVGAPRNFTDTGAAALEKFPSLKVLSLRNAKITDAALDKIATLKNLQELDLEETHVTDAGVAKLAGLSNLRRIVLSRTDVGTGVISTLSSMKSLKSIALQRTGVTADSVKQLQTALPTASISAPSPPAVDPNNPGGQPSGSNFNPTQQPGGRAAGNGLLPR
jgi:Leucine-rich repeat (LRR) protein